MPTLDQLNALADQVPQLTAKAASAQQAQQAAPALPVGERDAAGGVGVGEFVGGVDVQTFVRAVVLHALLLRGERGVLMIGGDTAVDGGMHGSQGVMECWSFGVVFGVGFMARWTAASWSAVRGL